MTDSEEEKQPLILTNYHWETGGGNTTALFNEGVTWDGQLRLAGPVIIQKVGPFLVPNPHVTYRVSGPLMDLPQEFGSFKEAVTATELVIRVAGHKIEGL